MYNIRVFVELKAGHYIIIYSQFECEIPSKSDSFLS